MENLDTQINCNPSAISKVASVIEGVTVGYAAAAVMSSKKASLFHTTATLFFLFA